jgi:hypothetical protein
MPCREASAGHWLPRADQLWAGIIISMVWLSCGMKPIGMDADPVASIEGLPVDGRSVGVMLTPLIGLAGIMAGVEDMVVPGCMNPMSGMPTESDETATLSAANGSTSGIMPVPVTGLTDVPKSGDHLSAGVVFAH